MDRVREQYNDINERTLFLSRRQLANSAAATAFWFFLSLVPIVILFSSLLRYTSITEEQVLKVLSHVLPGYLNDLIRVIIADVYSSSLAVISVSLIATLWSAACGFSSMIRGLELAYEQESQIGYFPRRLRGILYTIAMLFALILSVLLGGFGRQLAGLAETYLPGTQSIFSFLLRFRFLVVIAYLTAFFCLIFQWSTSVRHRFLQLLPGALISAAAWLLLSRVFSLIMGVTGSFGTYGGLASVIAVMLWLYYCLYVLLLSACLNRHLAKRLQAKSDAGRTEENAEPSE